MLALAALAGTSQVVPAVSDLSDLAKENRSITMTDPDKDGGPVSRPLYTVEEVLAWQEGSDPFCVASVPLASPEPRPRTRPQTLICHDMAGGYLQDRFVQGSNCGDAYRFYNWHHIDSFIYFSHHFITIPPPGWINAAHRHNVLMLGTMITEWDDGKARCELVLSSESMVHSVVKKLVEIAVYYKFDGWLINIENVVKEELLPNLVLFLDELTKSMHAALPHSQVIWYDSVISSGQLKWQDELNDLNSCYFDICDGIFLNYTWKDEGLERSANRAVSQNRPYDVYVGVDVFGRNCRGGGGFNTKEAVAAARSFNLSVAIFAQGWVYEKLGKENFTANENKFWSLIQNFCSVDPVTSLPLATTFCQGQGQKYFYQGNVLYDRPWTNLSLQNLQPTEMVHTLAPPSEVPPSDKEEKKEEAVQPQEVAAVVGEELLSPSGDWEKLELCPEAYTGGNSVAFMPHEYPMMYRLFKMDAEMPDSLVVWYTYKMSLTTSWDVAMRLDLQTSDHKRVLLMLGGPDSCEAGKGADSTGEALKTSNYCPLELAEIDSLLKHYPDQYAFGNIQNGWRTRVYRLNGMRGSTLKDVTMETQLCRTDAPDICEGLLGQIVLTDATELDATLLFTALEVESSVVTKVKVDDEGQEDSSGHEKWCVNATVSWTFPEADHYIVTYSYRSMEGATMVKSAATYLGRTLLPRFQVNKLLLPLNATGVQFLVQPITRLGLYAMRESVQLCLNDD